MTISGLCRSNTCRSASSLALERCTIRFGQTGAKGLPLACEACCSRRSISPSQPSSCSPLRQFTVGNDPITPLRQAATTRSTPETRNIGAAISGRLRRPRKRASGSGEVEVVRSAAMMFVVPRLHVLCQRCRNSGTTAGRVRTPKNHQPSLRAMAARRATVHRPSLRANGSRECAPDDRLREAIHRATQRKNGLLRRKCSLAQTLRVCRRQ